MCGALDYRHSNDTEEVSTLDYRHSDDTEEISTLDYRHSDNTEEVSTPSITYRRADHYLMHG